jgi:hypothetical protein
MNNSIGTFEGRCTEYTGLWVPHYFASAGGATNKSHNIVAMLL